MLFLDFYGPHPIPFLGFREYIHLSNGSPVRPDYEISGKNYNTLFVDKEV
jgi:hypothetical protein